MHCKPKSDAPNTSTFRDPPLSKGEIPAWQACGRIPTKERSDFYEFVLCNALFALVAFVLVVVRSKKLEAMQARQLAARIGLVRGAGGVLVRG